MPGINPNRPDYTSPVPKYKYAETLKEQETELKSDPFILRFIKSRESMADDPFRPLYHFVSPESTLNDPNGLCFWQGLWHMFYQGYPPEDRNQHWGHAFSKDLIHWKDLPYAIYPNPERSCFSGSTLVEENRVIAIYHGVEAGTMIATSSDPLLLNWDKLTGEPVIPTSRPLKSASDQDIIDGQALFEYWSKQVTRNQPRPAKLPYRVFDPCIWKKGDFYYSLSAGTLPHKPTGKRTRANFLFRSKDMITWEYLHPFIEGDRFTLLGDDGACPYFWPIGDRNILLFFSHMSGGQALLGDYDQERDKFVVSSHHPFNFGAYGPGGVHAPSATPDGKGGVIVIFNMNPAFETEGWDQIMSLPRRLSLKGEDNIARDSLNVEPAGAVESLRSEQKQIDNVLLPANREVVLAGIEGNAMEIMAEIDVGDSPMVEMNVLRSPNRNEFTRIAFYRGRGYRDWERYTGWDKASRLAASDSLISIDSSYSSTLPGALSRAPETGSVFLAPDEPLKLRVFVDRSVVEVFVNGRQCIAMRVYPGLRDSIGVSMRSQGQDAKIRRLNAWQMKSIY